MNNQEMQVADPESRRPQQSSLKTDPREQSGWQTPPPQQERVYTGSAPYAGPQAEKIGVGQYAQRTRSPWLWLILALAVIEHCQVVQAGRVVAEAEQPVKVA